eukprot:7784433-Pyramimonas_sp.AAC.1
MHRRSSTSCAHAGALYGQPRCRRKGPDLLERGRALFAMEGGPLLDAHGRAPLPCAIRCCAVMLYQSSLIRSNKTLTQTRRVR